MYVNEKVPFIRIINTNHQTSDKLWVLASIIRLMNVIRVWVFEAESRLSRIHQSSEYNQEDLDFFRESSGHITKMLRQSYVVLKASDVRDELPFLEEALFRFETLYLTSSLCLVVNEEKVEFAQERFEFLRHNLRGVLHDINQPISVLHSIISLVDSGDEQERLDFIADTQKVTVQTKAQLQRGFELIKGSFSVEELRFEELEQLTDETLEMVQKADHIDFEVRRKLTDGRVMYSSLWFRGLLTNIVDNAKKSFLLKAEQLGHGDFERKVVFEFIKGRLSNQHPALVFKVQDTGVGFNQDVIEKGFYEGKSLWEKNDLGSQGVGMAVHVEFIKRLRGEVELRNVNDHGHIEGAELLIKLPLV